MEYPMAGELDTKPRVKAMVFRHKFICSHPAQLF